MLSTQRLIVTFIILAAGATLAQAKDGRDFAGFYSLTDAIHEGDQVHVTLTLQLFNYSGADLTQAAVVIRHAPPETAAFGTYSPIELWRNGTDVKFTMHLAIPQEEYERWGGRRQPAVYVVNRNDQGREWQRTAQVSRRPAISLEDNRATQ
jgi:hypothetical protein